MAQSDQSNTDSNTNSGLFGEIEGTTAVDDFLNNLGAATSSAAASMSSRDWGVHNNNINMGGGTSLTISQVLLWGGVALLGWYVIKKIRGK